MYHPNENQTQSNSFAGKRSTHYWLIARSEKVNTQLPCDTCFPAEGGLCVELLNHHGNLLSLPSPYVLCSIPICFVSQQVYADTKIRSRLTKQFPTMMHYRFPKITLNRLPRLLILTTISRVSPFYWQGAMLASVGMTSWDYVQNVWKQLRKGKCPESQPNSTPTRWSNN